MSSLFIENAKKCDMVCKVKNKRPVNHNEITKSNKKWFNKECRQARCKYTRAKRVYGVDRSVQNHDN